MINQTTISEKIILLSLIIVCTYNYLFSFRRSVVLTYILTLLWIVKDKVKIYFFLYNFVANFAISPNTDSKRKIYDTRGTRSSTARSSRSYRSYFDTHNPFSQRTFGSYNFFPVFLSVLIPCLFCEFFFAGYNPNQKCWVFFLILWKLTFPDVLF